MGVISPPPTQLPPSPFGTAHLPKCTTLNFAGSLISTIPQISGHKVDGDSVELQQYRNKMNNKNEESPENREGGEREKGKQTHETIKNSNLG